MFHEKKFFHASIYIEMNIYSFRNHYFHYIHIAPFHVPLRGLCTLVSNKSFCIAQPIIAFNLAINQNVGEQQQQQQ
jgi:hypothetical protein